MVAADPLSSICGGGFRAAHCMHEHRESVAVSRINAPQGDWHPSGAGRQPGPFDPADADGKRPAGYERRAPWFSSLGLGHQALHCSRTKMAATSKGYQRRCASARVHIRYLPRDRDSVWLGAGAASFQNGLERFS